MSMSDWNDKKNGGQMVLSVDRVYEGVKSLRIHCLSLDEVVKILNKSETDLPKHVNFDFWLYIYRGAYDASFSTFFRYQDLDNFYLVSFIQWFGASKFIFGRKETGVYHWNAMHVLDANIKNQWVHWKIEFCEISGTVYATLYKEVAGEWVQKEAESQSPAKWASGGAVGVGAYQVDGSCGTDGFAYLDTTKIYY